MWVVFDTENVYRDAYLRNKGVLQQEEVTPIDSIVTTATEVGQRSTVKAVQKGAVNSQSVLRNTLSMVKACSEAVKRQIWAELHVRSKAENQHSQRSNY